MAAAVRAVGHDDRLPLVDHLTELRARLLVSAAALAVAFGFAFWQNHAVLHVLNRPLASSGAGAAQHSRGPLADTGRLQQQLRTALDRQRSAFELLGRSRAPLGDAERRALRDAAAADGAVAASVPAELPSRRPVTLGIGEPFTQTVAVSAYFAVILALPVLLWQLYAFVVPAFSPRERRLALPLLVSAPVLFVAGVAFGYALVLPAAVSFLQNFNADSFDALVQARTYYQFVLMTLLATGLFFEIPVAVIGLTRLGIVTTRQLRRNRRYVIVGIAALALLLPGTDPVTTGLEMAPMLVLFELSVLVAGILERRSGAGSTRGRPG